MYKVLIVDDEPLLRFAVRNLLKWEDYGFTVVGEGGDGREALEGVRKFHPDLIFTDIKMPNMDGLEFVQLLQKESTASVVIMSNYDDFSYAQTALRLGVDDYLLKVSLDAEHLKKILEEEKRKLDLLLEQNSFEKTVNQKFPDRASVLKKLIAQKGVSEELTEEQKALFPVFQTPYYVITLKDFQADDLYRIFELEKDERIPVLNGFMQNVISDKLRDKGYYFRVKDAGYVILLSEHDFVEFGERRFWRSITNLLERYTNRVYVGGISRAGRGIEQFYDRYQESVFAADRYFFDEAQQVFLYEDVCAPAADHLRGMLELFFTQSNELFWAVETQKLILNMLDEMKKAQLLSSNCKRIISNVILLYSVKVTDEDKEHLWEFDEQITDRIQCAGTYVDMRREVERYMERIEKEVVEIKRYSLPVQQTLKWIKEHYQEHITLPMAAEQIAVHPNHLSRIFSQQTGKTFSSYLNDYRMEKAKAFLSNRALSVQDIGEKVGIQNGKYFSDVFKKWCGYSPTEYRQIILDQKG